MRENWPRWPPFQWLGVDGGPGGPGRLGETKAPSRSQGARLHSLRRETVADGNYRSERCCVGQARRARFARPKKAGNRACEGEGRGRWRGEGQDLITGLESSEAAMPRGRPVLATPLLVRTSHRVTSLFTTVATRIRIFLSHGATSCTPHAGASYRSRSHVANPHAGALIGLSAQRRRGLSSVLRITRGAATDEENNSPNLANHYPFCRHDTTTIAVKPRASQ